MIARDTTVQPTIVVVGVTEETMVVDLTAAVDRMAVDRTVVDHTAVDHTELALMVATVDSRTAIPHTVNGALRTAVDRMVQARTTHTVDSVEEAMVVARPSEVAVEQVDISKTTQGIDRGRVTPVANTTKVTEIGVEAHSPVVILERVVGMPQEVAVGAKGMDRSRATITTNLGNPDRAIFEVMVIKGI